MNSNKNDDHQTDENTHFNGLFRLALERAQSTLSNKQDLVESAYAEIRSDLNKYDDDEEQSVYAEEFERKFLQTLKVTGSIKEFVENIKNNNQRNNVSTMEFVDSLVQITVDLVEGKLSGCTYFQGSNLLLPRNGSIVETSDIKKMALELILSSLKNQVQTASKSGNSTLKMHSNTLPSKRAFSSLPYRDNPAISSTALAHTLWSSILRPNVDSAIDATCGNGHDSVAIARMLFQSNGTSEPTTESHLLCIDIQQQACDSTTQALAKVLDSNLMKNNVQVVSMSHESLPRPVDSSSVGLIVYNLGWLPRSAKEFITQVESTISSLVDAFCLVRIDGVVSVLTYPKSNPTEDVTVRAFFECMSLLSSKVQSWEEFLSHLEFAQDKEIDTVYVKKLVRDAMHQVIERGTPSQTWRVSEHRKLGFIKAPILLSAVRIK